MLVIKCAACRQKLWKYDKIGKGRVLRCYKSHITKIYAARREKSRILCPCGNTIGIDKGTHIKMIERAITYTGTKRN